MRLGCPTVCVCVCVCVCCEVPFKLLEFTRDWATKRSTKRGHASLGRNVRAGGLRSLWPIIVTAHEAPSTLLPPDNLSATCMPVAPHTGLGQASVHDSSCAHSETVRTERARDCHAERACVLSRVQLGSQWCRLATASD